ncbi:MAG: hypothetical protein HY855_02890 [Burkholderiales bacterium]|nr:hypothetical protein [Burkholderiales bacterium]
MRRRTFIASAVAAMVPPMAEPAPMVRGELGSIDCGFTFIGADLAAGPDMTACYVLASRDCGPDIPGYALAYRDSNVTGTGWVVVVPPDPRIEWERALRGT